MPNHCANRLTVSGTRAARDAFVAAMRSDETALDFNRVVRRPDDVRDALSWCVQNWGTKWGAYAVETTHSDVATVYTFHTAWAPPSPAFMRKMAAKYPDVRLDLRFAERGVEFYGYWTAESHAEWNLQNGDVVEEVDADGEFVDSHLRAGLELYADLFRNSG